MEFMKAKRLTEDIKEMETQPLRRREIYDMILIEREFTYNKFMSNWNNIISYINVIEIILM